MRKLFIIFIGIAVLLLSGCPVEDAPDAETKTPVYTHLTKADCRHFVKNYSMIYKTDVNFSGNISFARIKQGNIREGEIETYQNELISSFDKQLKKIGISKPDRIKKYFAIQDCVKYLKWEEWCTSTPAILRIMDKYNADIKEYNGADSVDMRDVKVVREYFPKMKEFFFPRPKIILTEEEFNIFLNNWKAISDGVYNIRWSWFVVEDSEYDEFLASYGISGENKKMKYDMFKLFVTYGDYLESLENQTCYDAKLIFFTAKDIYFGTGDNMLLVEKYYDRLLEL